jgi:hypothetical protein
MPDVSMVELLVDGQGTKITSQTPLELIKEFFINIVTVYSFKFIFSSMKVFNCRVCLICISLISSNFANFRQLERFNRLLRSQERLFDARNANKGVANLFHRF